MALSPVTADFLGALAQALPDGVITKAGPRYLEDPRDAYQGNAAYVLKPHTTQEAAAIVRLCHDHKVGVIPYAGGTGLVGGQVAAIDPAPVLLSVERMQTIRDVDAANNTVTVGAGAVLADIQTAADAAARLFPLSMASEGSCRIGGNLATNAGGVQVLRYGNARDLCLGIEAVLPDGSIYHDLKGLRKDNTGYDLRNLLIGSEGSLGVITAATLKLFPKPQDSVTALVKTPSPTAAVDFFHEMQSRFDGLISAFELLHGQGLMFVAEAFPDLRQPFQPIPDWSVLVEITGGSDAHLDDRLMSALDAAAQHALIEDALVAQNMEQRQAFWQLRESIPLANRKIGAVSSHDISVPVSAIPAFIQAGFEAIEKIGPFRINCFGHLGDGNLHYNVFPPAGHTKADAIHKKDTVKACVYDLVHRFGGSFSAEHGIGRLKIAELEKYGDPTKRAALRAIKTALDPRGIMNPGVIIPV